MEIFLPVAPENAFKDISLAGEDNRNRTQLHYSSRRGNKSGWGPREMEHLIEPGNLQILLVIGIAIIVLIPVLLPLWMNDLHGKRVQQHNLQTGAADQQKAYQPASVCEVVDGCRVIVTSRGCRLILRLDSIDCPEQRLGLGEVAKGGLVSLIGGRDIVFEDHGEDAMGRTLATVFVVQDNHWINVNTRMVRLGYAWIMPTFDQHLSTERQDELKRMERYARSRSVGVWVAPDPEPRSASWEGH
jgi:endonuclease YncB( thermonuclease family)